MLTNCFSGVNTPMAKQNFIHHVLGYSLMYLSEWTLDYTTVFGIVMLFMEFSTIFSNSRWLMFQHGVSGGNIVQSINSVMLFFSFLICRIYFQVYTVVVSALPFFWFKMVDSTTTTFIYKIVLVTMALGVFVNMLLNFYWAYLIVN